MWLLADRRGRPQGYLVTEGDRVAHPIAWIKGLSKECLDRAYVIADGMDRPGWGRGLARGALVKLGGGWRGAERIKGLVMWPVNRVGQRFRSYMYFACSIFMEDYGSKERPLGFFTMVEHEREGKQEAPVSSGAPAAQRKQAVGLGFVDIPRFPAWAQRKSDSLLKVPSSSAWQQRNKKP